MYLIHRHLHRLYQLPQIIQNILQSNTILPNEILFEYNVLTNENEFKNTMDLLIANGYYEIERGFDTIKVKNNEN